MTTFLLIIHIVVCFFLIAVVLLQSGKGAEMGAAFGGSSQTLFGSRGAATFLSKLTTGAAILFMITSLLLAIVTTRSGSIIKKTPITEQQGTIPGTTGGPLQSPSAQPSQPDQQSPPPIQQPQPK